ncbi:MAG: hypothetical protein GAK28_04843 [Luteibacter sp.]|uniref:hypothetical protein n=1 Tax=Luteibacter sp. TaxID=1886636 RepID=UPI00138164FB|nr:hypothetical protein [Luteibacter sp.]KAF1003236.1 MAG: hypothetical protein GAK28_04843 [Luteibacter sp.]
MTPIKPGTLRQRPWGLLVTGDLVPTDEVLDEVQSIFELNPSIPGLELRADDGRACTLVREYASGHTAEVDDALEVIFAEQAEVAEIVVMGQEARPVHVATREAPFWHRDGKAIADISEKMEAGEISPTEAIDMLKSLFESDR